MWPAAAPTNPKPNRTSNGDDIAFVTDCTFKVNALSCVRSKPMKAEFAMVSIVWNSIMKAVSLISGAISGLFRMWVAKLSDRVKQTVNMTIPVSTLKRTADFSMPATS